MEDTYDVDKLICIGIDLASDGDITAYTDVYFVPGKDPEYNTYKVVKS